MSELADLLQQFETKYTAKGGLIERSPWTTDENGLAIPATSNPKLFTPERIAEAEDKLGMPFPEHLLELWEWADYRSVWSVDFGFLHTIDMAANPHIHFEDEEVPRGPGHEFPELRPFPGLMIASQDRVKLVLSLEEEDYGHLWIWRGYATVIEHSTWTSLEDFIRAQTNWLDGPIDPDGGRPYLNPQHQDEIDQLNMPTVVRHALSLRGPEHYWY